MSTTTSNMQAKLAELQAVSRLLEEIYEKEDALHGYFETIKQYYLQFREADLMFQLSSRTYLNNTVVDLEVNTLENDIGLKVRLIRNYAQFILNTLTQRYNESFQTYDYQFALYVSTLNQEWPIHSIPTDEMAQLTTALSRSTIEDSFH